MDNMRYSKDFSPEGLPHISETFMDAAAQPKGWQSDYFVNANQEMVFYARIPATLAEGQNVRGTVVVTTGYNDSIYNFYDTIKEWQSRGFNVFAMDWASQGASQRDPDHVNRPSSRPLDYHVRDLDQFIHTIVEPIAERPLILSTHSMGGAIGALYMKQHPDTFDQAVLGAPMLDLDTSILPRSWFKKIAEVASNIGLQNKSLPNWRDTLYKIQNFQWPGQEPQQAEKSLSEIFDENARKGFKPYELELPTWGWVRSAYTAMDQIRAPNFFRSINTEILFVSAGHDELVDNRAVNKAASEAANGRLLHLPESQHGVWGYKDGQSQLWSEIDRMIDHQPQIVTAELRHAPAESMIPAVNNGLLPAIG